jgi:hypothetical protein
MRENIDDLRVLHPIDGGAKRPFCALSARFAFLFGMTKAKRRSIATPAHAA